MSNHFIYLSILAIYLLGMLAVGFYFFRSNRDIGDYVLGGRKLNRWVAALSAQASDMSGWLLMGLPGTAYLLYGGTNEAVWTAIGLFLGTAANWLLVARPLRQQTIYLGALTLPEYFEKRYADRSGILRIVSALAILVFFLFYTASMFSAGAKLFQGVFGIPYTYALFIGAAIIVSYTFTGGFLAVCWTDLIQGTLLLAGLLLTVLFLWRNLPQTGNITASEPFSFLPKTDSSGVNYLMLTSALGWGLGYFGQPHILPRFLAVRSDKDTRSAAIIAIIWVFFALAAAVLCGVFGAFCFPGLADPETVFIVSAKTLFPPVVTGLLLTAILSAIMSTADSQLLAASSAVSADIYQKFASPENAQRHTLRIGRWSVLVISLLAIALVLVENPAPGTFLAKVNENLFRLVAFAWAGFGSAFGPIILFSLFWRRTSRLGAIFGIITGAVVAFVWRLNTGGIFDIYEIIPGFLSSAVIIFTVSLLTPAPAAAEKLFSQTAEEEEQNPKAETDRFSA